MEQKQNDTFIGFLMMCGMIFVFFIGIEMCGSSSKDNEGTLIEKASEKHQNTLFYSADDFKKAFNVSSSRLNFNFYIDDLKIISGEAANSFTCMLTNNISLVGRMNKSNGHVVELIIIGKGNGSIDSGTDILYAMLDLIATADPSIESEKRIDLLKELHFGEEGFDVLNMSTETYKNGIKYYIISGEQIGFWFGLIKE